MKKKRTILRVGDFDDIYTFMLDGGVDWTFRIPDRSNYPTVYRMIMNGVPKEDIEDYLAL